MHVIRRWSYGASRVRGAADRAETERTTKARQLLRLVVEISNALVDQGMLPVWDIPQLVNSAQVLAVTNLILERLREAQDSGTGPWD
jgi:hypothetical protein